MSTETNSNGIVYDLTNNSFKSLIERASALNFKFEDSKKDILEKLFKKESDEEAEEFINQLLRMATNLTNIANAYKKELDEKKSAALSETISTLPEDVRQDLIAKMIEKGFFPKSAKAKTKNAGSEFSKGTRKPREEKPSVLLHIGGEDYSFKPNGVILISNSFEDMTKEEVRSLFIANGIPETELDIKGKEGKQAFIAKYKK
ncbi:TPA: hypothetical protein I3776_001390 [Enterobacter cloacae]|uniref:hypothetical protein n=1 Tax=Shigella flexneri TaxID=623 RepID=UPI001C930771|nr:hypothetical protein [Shigella flexneri]QZN63008.1 hypothetical protein K5O10_15335 [Shigella flexneri]HAS1057783.1 hypothetical protein [Enterobacter cloacae]